MDKDEVVTATNCRDCPIREKTLFKHVPEERLDDFQRYRSEQLYVPARTMVFDEGKAHGSVYTLYSGWGIIFKTVINNNKRQILRFILPGDFIGCQTKASGEMTHSAAVLTPATLCVFSRDVLRQMLTSDAALAVRLVDMETREMSLCQSHLMATGRKTAIESISFLLLELFHRVQIQIPESFFSSENTIDFPLTQEDIGDAVGLTKIHVNRVIKKLVKESLIVFHKKQLTILDEKKLSEIAGFNADEITGMSLA
jgi:CRP-like cAMP-binding protein